VRASSPLGSNARRQASACQLVPRQRCPEIGRCEPARPETAMTPGEARCSLRTQRYGLRFHLVFPRYSIAIRLIERLGSSGGIVSRCTWRCMSCDTIVFGCRLHARASNYFPAISSFIVRVHLCHRAIFGFLYCIPTLVECEVVAHIYSPCSPLLGCGANTEGAPVFQACLVGCFWPTECISCSRMRNAMRLDGVILLHLANVPYHERLSALA